METIMEQSRLTFCICNATFGCAWLRVQHYLNVYYKPQKEKGQGPAMVFVMTMAHENKICMMHDDKEL